MYVGAAIGCWCVAFIAVPYAWLTLAYMGFPDGHIGDLGGVRRTLLWLALATSGAVSIMAAAVVAGRLHLRRPWFWFAGYLVVVLACLMAEAQMASVSGRGG